MSPLFGRSSVEFFLYILPGNSSLASTLVFSASLGLGLALLSSTTLASFMSFVTLASDTVAVTSFLGFSFTAETFAFFSSEGDLD